MNHMTGYDLWGTGTAGSGYDGRHSSYPGVPYEDSEFHNCEHCPDGCTIRDYHDHAQVQYIFSLDVTCFISVNLLWLIAT